MRAIADQSRVIRLPVHVHDQLAQISKARRELERELGRAATEEEVASRLDIRPDKLEFLSQAAKNTLALDAPKSIGRKGSAAGTSGGGEVTLGESMPDEGISPEEFSEGSGLNEDLQKLLATLTPREREVVSMRFGLADGNSKTLEEIGSKFSVTRERIRQIEARALHKLRQPYRNHKLREYVDSAID